MSMPSEAAAPTLRGTALVFAALLLAACGKTPPAAPIGMTTPVAGPTTPATAGGADASVPDAASVLAPAAAAKADPTAGRANGAMNAAQESSAMPMPGQNNDHSAPLAPPRAASSPAPLAPEVRR